MGVITKYQVDFTTAGLTVSNDLLSGDLVLDSEITAEMHRGTSGGVFEIRMFNLPDPKAKLLHDGVSTGTPAKVTIKLGYFDGDFGTVMEGVYTKVRSTVEGDQYVVIVKGKESATAALTATRITKGWDGDVSLKQLVTDILATSPSQGEVTTPAMIEGRAADASETVKDFRVDDETLMNVLDGIAARAGSELAVFDKRVHLGNPITGGATPPMMLVPDTNLARFEPFKDAVPDAEGANRLTPLTPAEATGFSFTITGHPAMRPARKVKAAVTDAPWNTLDFRVHSVSHSFSLSGGYICKGSAVKDCTDKNCRGQEMVVGRATADAVARDFSKLAKGAAKGAAVDVGKIESYNPGSGSAAEKHRATLHAGQKFAATETQPSIRSDVEVDTNKLAKNRPIVSPFAWHKCGLVVPVYPGMKAVLSHNLALASDAMVSGFLWSETPAIEPPANQAGDWWLCLPIGISGTDTPSDSTKAANDLIGSSGKRVIEVRALTIKVGDQMGTVGVRPTEGTDDELVIEHKSGTTVKIDANGAVTITGDVTIDGTLTVKKDVTIDGSVTIN